MAQLCPRTRALLCPTARNKSLITVKLVTSQIWEQRITTKRLLTDHKKSLKSYWLWEEAVKLKDVLNRCENCFMFYVTMVQSSCSREAVKVKQRALCLEVYHQQAAGQHWPSLSSTWHNHLLHTVHIHSIIILITNMAAEGIKTLLITLLSDWYNNKSISRPTKAEKTKCRIVETEIWLTQEKHHTTKPSMTAEYSSV